jgi:hypothetical protein
LWNWLDFLTLQLGHFYGPRGKFLCYCRLKDPSDDDDEDEGEESLLDELDDDFSNRNSSNDRFLQQQQQKTSSVTLPIRAPSSRPVCSNVYITTGSPLLTTISQKTLPNLSGHGGRCG